MADIFKAYKFLNESLKLELSNDQIHAAERRFKQDFAREKGETLSEHEADKLEFFGTLTPKKHEKE